MTGLVERLSRWSAWLAGALVLLSGLLIAGDVVLRNALRIVPFSSFELSRYLFAAATAFGFSFALSQRAHIRIDPLVKLASGRLRAWLDLLALAAVVPLAAVMTWSAWSVVSESVALRAISNSALGVPLAWPQSVWAVGVTWFLVTASVLTAACLRGLLVGDLAAVERLAGLPEIGGGATELAPTALVAESRS